MVWYFAFHSLLLGLVIYAWFWMANLIIVPILECIAGWSFIITQEVVIANTLLSLFWRTLSFRWCQKGKIRMTMHVLITPWISQPSLKFIFACVEVIVSIHVLLKGQYGHLVCHHQKGGICWIYPCRIQSFDNNKHKWIIYLSVLPKKIKNNTYILFVLIQSVDKFHLITGCEEVFSWDCHMDPRTS